MFGNKPDLLLFKAAQLQQLYFSGVNKCKGINKSFVSLSFVILTSQNINVKQLKGKHVFLIQNPN